MSTTRTDTPATWNDAQDVPFFRMTARLFTPEFCFGAGVLLASYDDDVRDDARTTATGTVDPHRPEAELVAVPVRRIR